MVSMLVLKGGAFQKKHSHSGVVLLQLLVTAQRSSSSLLARHAGVAALTWT